MASQTPSLKSSLLESRDLTIPGTGGTASRIPTRVPTVKADPAPPEPQPTATPPPAEKNVAKDMAEADTLRALTRSGGVILIKRTADEAAATPASTPLPVVVKNEDTPKPGPSTPDVSVEEKRDKAAAKPSSATAQLPPGITIFRRKTKMTDVARIILPSNREEPEEAPSAPSSPLPAAVIPPSFPVTVAAGSIIGAASAEAPSPVAATAPSTFTEISPAIEEPPSAASTIAPTQAGEESSATNAVETPKTESIPAPPEPEKKSDLPAPPFPIEETVASAPPKADPTPEQLKAPPFTPPPPPEPVNLPVSSREKQEFLLANGERILGRILSETTDTLFINHETLGVLTIPREQIAKRLIEIILINGDRIVGDVVAETPDCLYVRHASLGMLTVPHKQRSTRVVEAILKDGDRILGEVLAETENFTVIRSATLGTVAVQHTQVAMLNRKIEQIQLKALPPATPAIENKPAA
ncbi:MAG TPA: hypothetical protein VGC39_03025 [Candidatus Methylacidiphilales bacterium]